MLSSSAVREKSNTRLQLPMPSILRVHMNEKAPPIRTAWFGASMARLSGISPVTASQCSRRGCV